jgi:signal transduction histidine kinase
MQRPVEENDLRQRAYWLVRLRWLAALVVVLGTFVCARFLHLSVREVPLYTIAALLVVYNAVVLGVLNRVARMDPERGRRRTKNLIDLQISADLIILTVLLHFSGGPENPLVLFFLFHVIIASILLSVWESFLQATLAIALFGFLLLLESTGLAPHYCLQGLVRHCWHEEKAYLAALFATFGVTIYLVVYLASYIALRLRYAEEAQRQANRLLREKDRIKDEYVAHLTHDIKGHLAAIQSCLAVAAADLQTDRGSSQGCEARRVAGIPSASSGQALPAGVEGVPPSMRGPEALGTRGRDARDTTSRATDRRPTVSAPAGQAAEFVERAYRRTQKLTAFVRMLLRLTRLKLDGSVEMELFCVADAVREAVEAVQPGAEEKSLQLECLAVPGTGTISGNALSFKEAVTNLLLNAIKYTPCDGTVSIRTEMRDSTVALEVSDTGIGIPPEEQVRIFEEFYRASNARQVEPDGDGLGLSLVKRVVEMHGGTIRFSSRIGSGTTFYIVLPLAQTRETLEPDRTTVARE